MKVAVEGDKTVESLEILRAGFVQAVELAGRAAVKATEKAAKGTTLFKDRSGDTRESIKGEWQGARVGGFVRAGKAAGFLENGTKAHVIRGNPTLRFVSGGAVIFRRMVRHPGTSPRPFMHEAREIGATAAAYYAALFVGEAVRRTR